VLAASFAGTMASSPLAGRLIERMPANRITLAGAVLSGAGLIAIGSWNVGLMSRTPVLLTALIAQGFGVGLFQVAYMDVVIGTIPQRDRGVSGSIAMLTRTLGIVGGATLLSLVFNSIDHRALSGGAPAPEAFMTAFRTTFYAAGLVSILTGAAALVASIRRRP
jgi:MFS family permease